MRQWSRPQNSAHRPSKLPTVCGVTSIELSIPWMRSRFSRKSGTQNEWMTSVVRSTRRAVRPSGNTRCGGRSTPDPEMLRC